MDFYCSPIFFLTKITIKSISLIGTTPLVCIYCLLPVSEHTSSCPLSLLLALLLRKLRQESEQAPEYRLTTVPELKCPGKVLATRSFLLQEVS